MSRCFPYPPPGYTIRSIGVVGKDKEKEKKRKRENAEKIKIGQRNDDVIVPTKEEVERSGITEEHGDASNYASDCNSGKRKRLKRRDHIPTSGESRRHKKLRKAAHEYRDLIENWNPPAFSVYVDADCYEDDWLSPTKKHDMEKTTTSSCSGSSSLWPPKAQFLPDANIYARPYVLPF